MRDGTGGPVRLATRGMPREFAAANLQAESYFEREHNARWAALGVAHATSGITANRKLARTAFEEISFDTEMARPVVTRAAEKKNGTGSST